MHQQTIRAIVEELSATLVERSLGKIFQLTPFSLVLDLRGSDGRYLFVSAEPALPRIYLVSRRARELEKQSVALSAFGQAVRVNLGGGKLLSIKKDPAERIVRFDFKAQDEIGEVHNRALIAQLTGRSANLLLLDNQDRITHALRSLKGSGQQVGEKFEAPRAGADSSAREPPLERGIFESLSAAADDFYQQLEAARAFDARAADVRARLRNEAARLGKLRRHLKADLAGHGDPETHKRLGDLLLANIANAERHGNKVKIKDFYVEGAPLIEIEVDRNSTLPDEAARYFARYTKAKRATREITKRLELLQKESAKLERSQEALETIIAARDEIALAAFAEESRGKKPAGVASTKRRKREEKIPGVRRYLSSDGYEILVGRAARDNDHLAFRIARPHDLWLHAADYPGSHVIVRNSNRKDIPHRTVIEAAQLAAKFSQASKDPKVGVHYTQRKFVSRIKGAAPGLVRLSSFKTITVEPRESVERI